MAEPQIQVRDKWDEYVVVGDTLEEAALKLLRQRVEQDFWYYNYNEGNPETQYEDRAKAIVESSNGPVAWQFLCERSDHEYEYVQVAHTL